MNLQSNLLTGSIPVELSDLQNATIISLSHNELKGTIPLEFEKMQHLKIVSLHGNRLFGTAPTLFFKDPKNSHYITDCGEPSFESLLCDSCTMCCDADGLCQKADTASNFFLMLTILFLSPLAISPILKYAKVPKRDPELIYCYDSVYCFFLTKNAMAWIVHFVTALAQILLLSLFVFALNDKSEWRYPEFCPKTSLTCDDEKINSIFGWILFSIVVITHLGKDLVKSVLQQFLGVENKDLQLIISGLTLYYLTMFAVVASFFYNVVLAASDVELITNTVVLLFINDIDEKLLEILQVIFPAWTNDLLDQVKENQLAQLLPPPEARQYFFVY